MPASPRLESAAGAGIQRFVDFSASRLCRNDACGSGRMDRQTHKKVKNVAEG